MRSGVSRASVRSRLPLADDLVAGRERDEVGEALDRDGVAVADEVANASRIEATFEVGTPEVSPTARPGHADSRGNGDSPFATIRHARRGGRAAAPRERARREATRRVRMSSTASAAGWPQLVRALFLTAMAVFLVTVADRDPERARPRDVQSRPAPDPRPLGHDRLDLARDHRQRDVAHPRWRPIGSPGRSSSSSRSTSSRSTRAASRSGRSPGRRSSW